jgi:predicted Zn-dependent protease
MDDLLRARATGDSWRVGRDIMEAHEKSGDMAQMLSTAEEYLRRFPTKNPLQIGYARALMKLGRHAECMEYLKGVKILPSEHRDSATGIWHECQKALGLQPTWPENLGQGEPYHDGEWRQTE